jgi:uncharacterized phage protein gp47/JayE
MSDYGVTKSGFRIKPFEAILDEKMERARAMFGDDADLRETSALRKLLDISSAEDLELWKGMEQLYYGGFISTASGVSLDLLGEDLGLTRRFLPAEGKIKFTLSNEAPGRVYHLPLGTIVETDPPVRHFRTLRTISLSAGNKEQEVEIAALERGPDGNVAANTINKINAVHAQRYLNLGTAAVAVKNEAPLTGGERLEDDAVHRERLLGHPRTVWTLPAVTHAVKQVDGVRDCRVFDPLGGVDVSLSKFNEFRFGARLFGTQRLLGTPYFFDILVALQPGFPWESAGGAPGVREAIENAIRDVRPISIFPNLRQANNVLIGLRAKVLIKAGHDRNAVAASIKNRLETRVDSLTLGGGVLYSAVLRDCLEVTGVIDVQQLRLRRSPGQFSRFTFGSGQRFQSGVIEAAVGENLTLLPDEIAVFKIDAELIDLEVSDR